jgi:hypothetical protein
LAGLARIEVLITERISDHDRRRYEELGGELLVANRPA